MEFPHLHPKSYEAIHKTKSESSKWFRPKIMKNLAVLCVGTLMFFTAYDALTMLQSTMNRKGGIGVISQATLYAFFCVSAILLPKFFISRYGSKNTSVAAMFAYLPYIASNYYPHWGLMIPSSILLGIAGPLLWSSHAVYVTGLSMLYSGHDEPTAEDIVSYKTIRKDCRKKSRDDLTQQKYLVPNAAVKDCDCESIDTSCLQSRKRMGPFGTSIMRSHSSNSVSDELMYGKSKEASSLQSRKRLDSRSESIMRSPSLGFGEIKYGERKEASCKRLDSRDTSNMPSPNLVSDDIKCGESKGDSKLESRKRLDFTNNSIMRSTHLDFNQIHYSESKGDSNLESRKILDIKDSSVIGSNSSNLISELPSSNQPNNSVIRISSSGFHDSRFHENSNNVPFEENIEDNETKKLVAKAPSSLLSSTTAKFFGFHGMAHFTSHIWSSLLSYFTLKTDDLFVDYSNSSCRCGAEFCSVVSECFESNAGNPGANVRTILTSICVCMCLISILIVGVFLDKLDQEKRPVYFSFDFLNATCAILRRKEMLFLIPLSIHTGLVQGFYVGDFNKSYVACAWGTYHVGLVAMCYGLACGVSSLLSGWCVRHCGRRPVFTSAAVVNVISVVFLLLWMPDSKLPKMFFFASALWGIHVGIVWSQLRAFYGVLFPSDEEAAFSAFHLWFGLGFCVAFAFSNFFCISHKLFVILAVSVLGFCGYFTVELIYCKKNKDSY